jgi:hypothetical protein
MTFSVFHIKVSLTSLPPILTLFQVKACDAAAWTEETRKLDATIIAAAEYMTSETAKVQFTSEQSPLSRINAALAHVIRAPGARRQPACGERLPQIIRWSADAGNISAERCSHGS